MLHRAGNVDGEGDGCGVLLDIPRSIWAEEIRAGGHASHLALDPQFAVGHIFIARKGGNAEETKARAREIMSRFGLRVLAEREDVVDSSALGPTAREEEPIFWQVGGLIGEARALLRADRRARAGARRARGLVLHRHLRLQGDGRAAGARQLLPGPARRARRDGRGHRPQPLLHEHLAVASSACSRSRCWATTARSTRSRKLRQEARMLNVPIHADGSDSQDLNRTVESLVTRGALSLVEALELVLPPIVNEIKQLPEELRAVLHVPAPGLRAVRTGSRGTARAARRRDASSRSTRSDCGRSGSSRPPTSYVFSSRAGRRCRCRRRCQSPSRSRRARR